MESVYLENENGFVTKNCSDTGIGNEMEIGSSEILQIKEQRAAKGRERWKGTVTG